MLWAHHPGGQYRQPWDFRRQHTSPHPAAGWLGGPLREVGGASKKWGRRKRQCPRGLGAQGVATPGTHSGPRQPFVSAGGSVPRIGHFYGPFASILGPRFTLQIALSKLTCPMSLLLKVFLLPSFMGPQTFHRSFWGQHSSPWVLKSLVTTMEGTSGWKGGEE